MNDQRTKERLLTYCDRRNRGKSRKLDLWQNVSSWDSNEVFCEYKRMLWAEYLKCMFDLYTQTTNVHSLRYWTPLLIKYNIYIYIYKFHSHFTKINSILYFPVYNYNDISTYQFSKKARIAQSVWRLATCWTVLVLNPDGRVRFPAPVQTGPCGSPSLLYNRYRVFPGGKADGAWCWPPPQSSAEVEGWVELYIYSPSGPLWPLVGWPLPLLFPFFFQNTSLENNQISIAYSCKFLDVYKTYTTLRKAFILSNMASTLQGIRWNVCKKYEYCHSCSSTNVNPKLTR
jgi:hypothetical protein